MRPLADFRGLRFPDPYVVRHFSKYGLGDRTGRVLDLGCGSGNNLVPFAAAGWTGFGLDAAPGAVADARHNFPHGFEFELADLTAGLPPLEGRVDAVLVMNLLCYLSNAEASALLGALPPLMAGHAPYVVRTRLTGDARFGMGEKITADTVRMTDDITGECGLAVRFTSEEELRGQLQRAGLTVDAALEVRFDNVQSGEIVRNHDIVVWGTKA